MECRHSTLSKTVIDFLLYLFLYFNIVFFLIFNFIFTVTSNKKNNKNF